MSWVRRWWWLCCCESCRACVLSSPTLAALAACLGPIVGPHDVSVQRWGAGGGKIHGRAQASGWGAGRDDLGATEVLPPPGEQWAEGIW